MKRVDFKNIEIENFLSVGNKTVSIDFNTGLNVITGINLDKTDSKNGVGKTTIADALFFCLFGTTIRELTKDDIINNINKKRCRVRLEFDVTENGVKSEYTLERKIAPTKLHFEIDGEDATKSTMPKTTAEVCEIIGADPDVFRNAVIMTVNGTVPFMAQKKVEKRKFCEGLFNLSIFQDMLLEGRRQYNDTKNELSIEEAKFEEVSKALNIYTDQKKKKDQYKIERTNKLNGRKVDNLNEIKQFDGSLRDVNIDDIRVANENISMITSKIVSIQSDIKKSIESIATKREVIRSKHANKKALKDFGDRCDKCERAFTDDDKNNRDKKIKSILKEISSTEDEISKILLTQEADEKLKSKCNKAIEKQRSNITDINTNVEYNKNITARIEQLKTWNKQIKIDIEALENDGDELDTIISDTQKRLNALGDVLKDMNDNLVILDYIKHIVSEEGVKSFIIKKLLKVLNGKLAYYLIKLDAPCKFKFDEYFDEQIINESGEECSYNNFSSGEKKRIDLAILFTFMDIRRLQGSTSINVAFYDEILDTSLDDKGIRSFLDIIQERVETQEEACYIISHKNTAVKSATDDVIFLEKENGFTTIGNIEEHEFLKEL
jgi:DNA repair exonuclease SbcCD ATPase subunit